LKASKILRWILLSEYLLELQRRSAQREYSNVHQEPAFLFGEKEGGGYFMAKIIIKELESLTANDAGRIIRKDGNLAG
jgi:hypothetical protein